MEPSATALVAFDRQRRNAASRNIPFLLTFEQWWDWWQTDNRWVRRGRHSGSFVMGRLGDVGPYALGNIYCSEAGENRRIGRCAPAAIAKAIKTHRKRDNYGHLRVRASHPRARAVISPRGIFPSIALAAEANGVKARYAQQLASKGWHGWRYVE